MVGVYVLGGLLGKHLAFAVGQWRVGCQSLTGHQQSPRPCPPVRVKMFFFAVSRLSVAQMQLLSAASSRLSSKYKPIALCRKFDHSDKINSKLFTGPRNRIATTLSDL